MTDLNQEENDIVNKAFINGDLNNMTQEDKVKYFNVLCKSLGLNPATRPFQLISFRGRQILYATKDATDQLRKINGVSITKLEKTFQDDLYIVTVTAQDSKGRQDAATGAITIARLKGDDKCNAIMKCESKAKRRVTLSICGLGMLDESETDTIGQYQKIDIANGSHIESEKTGVEIRQAIIIEEMKKLQNLDDLKKYAKRIAMEVQSFYDEAYTEKLRQLYLDKETELKYEEISRANKPNANEYSNMEYDETYAENLRRLYLSKEWQ